MAIQNCPKCKRDQRDPKTHRIAKINGDGKPVPACLAPGDPPDLVMEVYNLMMTKSAEKAERVRKDLQGKLDAEKSAHEQTVIDRNSYAAGEVDKAKRAAEADKAGALAPLYERIGQLERTNAELSGRIGTHETELRSALDALAASEARAATVEASAKEAEAKYARLAAGAVAKDAILGEQAKRIVDLETRPAARKADEPAEAEMSLPTDPDDVGTVPTPTAPAKAAAKPAAVIVENEGDSEDDEPAAEVEDERVEEETGADEADEAKTAPAEPPTNGNGADLCVACNKRRAVRKTSLPLTSGSSVDAGICQHDECRTALYEQTFGKNLVEVSKLPAGVKIEDDFDFAQLFTPIGGAQATAATN